MQKLRLARLGAGRDVHRATSAVAQEIQTMVFTDNVQGDLMRMTFIRPQKKKNKKKKPSPIVTAVMAR